MFPAHIAEHSDEKMDAMEGEMGPLNRLIRRSLDELAVPAATASYTKFSDLCVEIIKLSRENTNVRSLSLSLNEKRKALATCETALSALQLAIEREPVPGKPVGRAIY